VQDRSGSDCAGAAAGTQYAASAHDPDRGCTGSAATTATASTRLVDDVQFLAGKGSTQDESFHAFDALHENHKQTVLTADRKPHEISDIADRLRTRFAWGLLVDLEPPELGVRIAILRKKAAVEAVALPDDVAM
jgi:chromosomal replication initiator protein